MSNNRYLIIGAVITVVVVIAGYFMLTGDEGVAPQPTAPVTQPKS